MKTAVVLLALALAIPAQARVLKGRLFLGRDLHIYMQEDESLVTDLLRSISLVRSEVPVVNLSGVAVRPDQLVIAADHTLYAADGKGAWAEVGRVDDCSAIKLAPGVTLALQRDVAAAFAGETGEKLAVRVPDSAPREAAPKPATFTDWLAELDRLGADLPASKAPPAAYQFLFDALAESLPQDGHASPGHVDNFRALKAWIEHGPLTAHAPFEQLLKRLKKGTQVKLVGGRSDGVSTSDGARLLSAYEELEAALHQR